MTATARLQVLRPEQSAPWTEVLAQSLQYDFYHLAGYHRLAEQRGEGQAHLFVYREGPYLLALPLLLRPLEAVPGLGQVGRGWWDATSVYGYAGPILSRGSVPPPVVQNFQAALREALQERKVVAVFSRLHPLLPQREVLAGLGEYVPGGPTVSIDLTLPVDVQRARYRQDHKYGINKLRRLGVTCVHDPDRVYLPEFVYTYHEAMRRVKAADAYFFDYAYFEKLLSTLPSIVHLFVCLWEKRVLCGGLFTLCDGLVQYHLSGTRDEFLKLAPMKLLLDEVRLWANARGARVFHLGGGVGSREDSLFQFKAGFSNRRHEFATWRWVLLPDLYDRLCKEKARWNRQNGLNPVSAPYFPEYRRPIMFTQAGIDTQVPGS